MAKRDQFDSEHLSNDNPMFTRRRQLLAALGIGAVAGCLGDDDGAGGNGGNDSSGDDSGTSDSSDADSEADANDSDAEQSGEPVVDTFSEFINPDINLEMIGFNTWNPTTHATFTVPPLNYQQPVEFNEVESTYEPLLVSEWQASEDDLTMTLTVADGYEWSNGDAVTAEDFETAAQIELGMFDGATDEFEDVTVDGNQIVYHLTEWINPEIIMGLLLSGGVTHLHYYRDGPYTDFADQFADGSNDDEYESVKSDLEEFTVRPREGDTLPSSGLFQVDSVTDNYITMAPNPGHPERDSLNFDQVELLKAGEWSSIQALLMSENLDYAAGRFANTFLENVPDQYHTWLDERYGGNAIDFQLTDEIFGIREVRQAINHIMDKELAIDAIDFEQIPDQYSTGMPDSIAEAWLDQETLDSFTDYTGQNFDEAARLLQEAGFEEGSNTWLTPDGEEWQIEFAVAAGNSDRLQQMEVARDLVQDFGINATVQTIETSTYWQRYRDRDWTVAAWTYGDRGNAHPYFDFVFYYIGEDPGALPGEREPWAGTPYEFEVPMPVGEPDGDMETVNYREKINQIRAATDEDEARGLIRECAWIWNQMSFKVPIGVETMPMFLNTQEWNAPDDHPFEDYGGLPYRFLADRGQFQAREE